MSTALKAVMRGCSLQPNKEDLQSAMQSLDPPVEVASIASALKR
jgi:hypothetical protein